MAVQRFVCSLLWLLAVPAWAQPLIQEGVTYQSDGRTQVEVVTALLAPVDEAARQSSEPQGQSAGQWPRQVALPDGWSKPQRSGRWRYVWAVEFTQEPTEIWGLYISKIGNRFAVEVNGMSVEQAGDFGDPSTNFAQHPHLIALPRGSLIAGMNHFVIELEGERSRFAGLSRVQLASERALQPVFAFRSGAQLGGTLAVGAMSLVFGALALVLFMRLRENCDLFFAGACLFCALRTSYFVVEAAPMHYRLWTWVADLSYVGSALCIVAFGVRALALKVPRWDSLAKMVLVLSTGLVTWSAFGESYFARQIWLQLLLGYALLMSGVIVWRWWRQRTMTSGLLGMAALSAASIGVHDHWMVYYSPQGYGGLVLAHFALVPFILAMSWIIVERLGNRIKEERAMRESIAHELEEKKQELAQEFQIKSSRATERAQGVEREKLMQDLHDGMGLQLNSLLGLVEKGDAGPGEVQTEVRNSIEQLRNIVDGSEAFDGNLPELLGHIRFRIETRLKRQSIQLVWAGHLGERMQRVRPSAAVSLQRLVFELCTNVIKHARAHNVHFTASLGHLPDVGEILLVLFEDDGPGVGSAVSGAGTGQRSILRRVAELGGTYEQTAIAGAGWKHQLTIPVSFLES